MENSGKRPLRKKALEGGGYVATAAALVGFALSSYSRDGADYNWKIATDIQYGRLDCAAGAGPTVACMNDPEAVPGISDADAHAIDSFRADAASLNHDSVIISLGALLSLVAGVTAITRGRHQPTTQQ